jgi:hypothetical protein
VTGAGGKPPPPPCCAPPGLQAASSASASAPRPAATARAADGEERDVDKRDVDKRDVDKRDVERVDADKVDADSEAKGMAGMFFSARRAVSDVLISFKARAPGSLPANVLLRARHQDVPGEPDQDIRARRGRGATSARSRVRTVGSAVSPGFCDAAILHTIVYVCKMNSFRPHVSDETWRGEKAAKTPFAHRGIGSHGKENPRGSAGNA